MPFTIFRQDITKMQVDAIVNAANTDLKMGGGVCKAIFQAAGEQEIQAACDQLAPIKTGEAVMTPGFGLLARYVIHVAGPIFNHWSAEQSEKYLRAAYTSSLCLAQQNSCESIAFPLIASGIYGYPKNEAFRVASETIQQFLQNNDLNVFLVVFDKDAFAVSKQHTVEVRAYVD
jgi:O-acetyl-ADP-ribose deacetylase (regulator of RNase III)